MPIRHLLSIADLEYGEMMDIIHRSLVLATGTVERSLIGKAVGIYFRKTSTRTRTSFSIGAGQLGAVTIAYGPKDLQTNTGENIEDTASVLACYLDALVVRTAESIAEMKLLASQNKMAIINAMSDNEHPTQALADLATMKACFDGLENIEVLYVGEGNNTAAALALALNKIPGARLTVLSPPGYGIDLDALYASGKLMRSQRGMIEQYHSCEYLPKGADVVYTTRWQTTGTSKGDPHWRDVFEPFRVTKALMETVSKPSRTIFMHDLPAVRGEEVDAEVLDGPQSVAFRQAHYKLFSAMAVLEWCILGKTLSRERTASD